MRLSLRLTTPAAFLAAAVLATLAAWWAVSVIESRSEASVADMIRREGLSWATVRADGLQVRLYGTAPNEAQRFRAMNLTASLVDSGRIRDLMEVTPASAIVAPRFSVELLRNDDGISLIGLVPTSSGEDALAESVAAIAKGARITDMLEQADFPMPEGWQTSVDFGLAALRMLPRSKISIAADRVAITAIANSEAEKRRFETDIARARPAELAVDIDISAPRPVLTPFTLRFVKDSSSARFDACSVDTEAARERIVAAAVAAGMSGKADCTIGLGVPTPRWAEGVEAGIKAVAALGAGSITFSDADVSLQATVETPQATFDRAVGELQAALPDVFSLKATLPEKPKATTSDGPPEFTAALSKEGRVELRGRLTDESLRDAVSNFARARFGADAVYTATRLDPELPDGWAVRVLAGLDSLGELSEGTLLVRADTVEVTGLTGNTRASAEIARLLSGQLGQGQDFKVDVRYVEALDPTAALPTPQECVTDLNAVLARKKIAFAPGSAEIEAEARETMDALADILKRCPDIPMEIAGHTDSQGSEGGNLALSQARADAVLVSLQGRRVLVGALVSTGYGETRPIADNKTEEGREANRRIEFTLLGDGEETPDSDGDAAPAGSVSVTLPVAAPPAPPTEPAADGTEASKDAVDDGAPTPEPELPRPTVTSPLTGITSGAGPAPDASAAKPAPAGPAADSPDAAPEEPFTSSAPAQNTLRPKSRPPAKP